MKSLIINPLLLLLVLVQTAFAQLDAHHFIPPIYYGLAEGGGDTGNFDRHYLVLSTPSVDPVTVKVTDGGGNIILDTTLSNAVPIVHLLGRLTDGAYQATSATATGNVIGTSKLNQPVTDGLIVDASAPIYANIRHQSGYQGASLTAKGCAALGREFRVATMRNNNVVHNYRSVFFSAMATEDNTILEIDDIKSGIVFTNTAASGTTLTSDNITVTLQRGESYVVGIKLDQYAAQGGTAPINHLNGTRIRSTKPVVMNSGTVLGCPDRNNVGSRDMGFDQIAPVTRAGSEYIFVKGAAPNGSDLETPTIVVTEDNTNIFVNGALSPINSSPLNAGDYLFVSGEYTGAGTLYLSASKPVLAWQTIAGANSAATPGLNFVPPLNPDITTSVDNIANIDLIGEATVNIVARTGASVTINGTTPATGPIPVPGTTEWVLHSQTGLTGNPSIQSSAAIAVSLVMLKSPIGAGAYYSGYPDFKPLIEPEDPTITRFPGIVLKAIDPSGGILANFEWFHVDGTSTGITGDRFEPTAPGRFYVTASSGTDLCPVEPSAISTVERYPFADLEITQSLSEGTVEAGSIVTFTISVINHGPDDANEILVNDILPDGFTYIPDSINGGDLSSDNSPDNFGLIWQINQLSATPGSNIAVLTLDAFVHASGNHNNKPSVSSDLIDSNTTDNASSITLEVLANSDPVDPDDLCACDDTYIEFNIRDLDLLSTYNVYPTQYDAARDVWHLVKDVLHCREEGIPLEEEKRGFNEEEFFIAEDSEVVVTVIYDGADYYNSVAFYDAADPSTTWKTIWESFATGPSAPLIPGSSASLGVIPAGTELRFGLVMDGGNGGTRLIHQDAYLNPGGLDFMASNILGDLENKPLIVAFEDQLFEGRDNDFNDVILKIDIIPTAMGIAQHDETIEGQDGLNSDRGSRGITALLENHGINDPSYESTAELFDVPAGLTELTFTLLDDRSPMKFTLCAFDYNLVSHLNPESPEFRTIAATTAIPLMDNRTMQSGDEVTINPKALGLSGKIIGLMMIPNNTVENYLKNSWRYTPTGDGDNTKRQPLFSLINANPSALDQMLAFYDGQDAYLTFEDSSNIDGTGDFDDIQLQMSPALDALGFHNGQYFDESPDPTEGFVGPDGYGEHQHGGF
ncbi:DUF4114 domain-containing protein [Verrucomicrobiaceae bacterium 227]